MTRRPRSRKQLYRAEALLELDQGRPIEEVARRFRAGIERVEEWIEGFTEMRLRYLDEPRGSKPRARHNSQAPGDDADEGS